MNNYYINKSNGGSDRNGSDNGSNECGNYVGYLPVSQLGAAGASFLRQVSEQGGGSGGLNELLIAAIPLLLLMIKLKNISVHPDLEKVNVQALKELRMFEVNATRIGYAPRMILAASYSLCTAFDEAVLATSWGEQGAWTQHTLLSKIHRETWGGERFYIILNKMAAEPSNNLDILELFYVLLSLGFEGKYFNQAKEAREELRYALFNLIKNYRGIISHATLSPSPIDNKVAIYKAQKPVSLRHVGKIVAGVFMILLAIFNYKGYVQAAPLLTELQQIAK